VAPAFTDALVLAATDDGVVAFERASGERRWAAALGQRPSTPVVVGGRAVVTTWEGGLFSFEVADGRRAWSAPLPGASLGPPASAGGLVVATWESEAGTAAGA